MDYFARKTAAAKRRAKKIGVDTSHPFFATAGVRAVNGNAWDAHWVAATNSAGQMLMRDGRVFNTTMEAMDAIPAFKAALMRKFVPEARNNPPFFRYISQQKVSSHKTSRPQVPALHQALIKRKMLPRRSTVLDLGGGRYDIALRFLRKHGIVARVFDPFNRRAPYNEATIRWVDKAGVDVVLCANVLNVIAERGARQQVIKAALSALKDGGVAYFSTYEGSGTGRGATTVDGWQNNRKTKTYLREVRSVFPRAERRGAMIVAPA